MRHHEHLQVWEALKTERASWVAHWRDISDHLLPRSGRFFAQDRNRGEKRHNNILDETGTQALATLAAGMQAGMNSPARPWFKLTTADPDLAKQHDVKMWLDQVTKIMLRVFHKSNFYRAMHMGYEELGGFGSWSCLQVPDFQTVTHFQSLTVGEYAMATNWKGEVDTLFRHFEATVNQLVREFGLENCSPSVQQSYRNNHGQRWVEVVHAIRPREDRDRTKLDGKNMPFESVYFELGGNQDKYLRVSGFKSFPGWGARWHTRGGDVYGYGPGMLALGSVRQLQHEQMMKGKAISFQADPPVQVPVSLRAGGADLLPGGVSFVDSPQNAIRTAFDVPLRLDYLLGDLQDVRQRIRESFHTNLFLMLASSDRTQMTATEVAQRYEEKMLMLGPVLERVTHETHVPAVNNTFDELLRAGVLPPPPDSLADQDLNVEFVSMLAQAQRAVSTNAVDRFVANLGVVAQLKPDVLDKFDADVWADEYADMTGVSPEFIVAGDKVALIRKARAEAAQQQAQAEQAALNAQTVKNLATSPSGAGTVGGDLMNQFSGYSIPAGA